MSMRRGAAVDEVSNSSHNHPVRSGVYSVGTQSRGMVERYARDRSIIVMPSTYFCGSPSHDFRH